MFDASAGFAARLCGRALDVAPTDHAKVAQRPSFVAGNCRVMYNTVQRERLDDRVNN